MKTITALIIDDERLAREGLRKKLEKIPVIEVIGEAKDIATATNLISKLKPQLLFLDIQLSEGTGFDLLNQIEFPGKVIFITAYDEYALRAFEVNAVDYIMKPISDERLRLAIDKAILKESPPAKIMNQKLQGDDRIMISKRTSLHFIQISTIIYIQASRDYTIINTNDKNEYLDSHHMNEWENLLPENMFMRIHRSYIANFDYIERTDKGGNGTALVYLVGVSEPIVLSRTYYKRIRQRYGKINYL